MSSYDDGPSTGCLISMVVAFVVLLIVLPAVFFGARVLLSGPEGRGDQIIQNNSNLNRTGQQQNFEDLYGDIKAYGPKIENAKRDLAANNDPSRQAFYQTNLSGVENVCTSTVEQFNADSNKILAQDWKTPDVPQHLDAASLCS